MKKSTEGKQTGVRSFHHFEFILPSTNSQVAEPLVDVAVAPRVSGILSLRTGGTKEVMSILAGRIIRAPQRALRKARD